MKNGKTLSRLMMLVLGVLVLASCGSQSGDVAAPTAQQQHDPVTVKMRLLAAYEDVFHTFVDPVLKEKYPYITLEYASSQQSLPQVVAAGDVPDIIMQNGSLNGILDVNLQYDMNELIKKNKFDLKKLDPDLLKSAQAFGPKGELYALPTDRSVQVLLYNKDIFDKFNVPYPKDVMLWEDAIALAKRLTRSEGGVDYHGLLLGDYAMLKSQLQIPFFSKEGKALLTTPEWQKMAQTWKALYDIPGNYTKTGVRDAFTKDRNAAMIITTSSFLLRNPIPDLNWDYVVMPTFENHLIKDKLGAMMTITSTSKNKDAAFDVVSLYFSDDIQTKVSRTASLVSGSNVPEIVKQYGADAPGAKGKNLKVDFTGNASIKVVEQYDNMANPIVKAAFDDIATGKQDVNTALRQAEEKVNQKVAEEKAK
jgi:multiple sugar transport system substrate-binding protein